MKPKDCCLISFLLFAIAVFSGASDAKPAEDPSFILKTTSLSPYHSGYIGNGNFSLASTPLAVTPAGSYMIKVYDHAPGDVPRIARLPDWNEIDFSNGASRLSQITPTTENIRNYTQELNMRNASLVTRYDWMDGKKATHFQVETFVSRSNPQLAAQKIKIIPKYNGAVAVSFSLRGWDAPKRLELEKEKNLQMPASGQPIVWYPGRMIVKNAGGKNETIWMISSSEGRQTEVAQVAKITFAPELKADLNIQKTSQSVVLEVRFQSSAGNTYEFTKYAAIFSSMESKDPLKTALDEINSLNPGSYQNLFEEHSKSWDQLWQTDIVISGDHELQKLLHSMIFYLLCSVRENTDFSLPPMGLSSDGYYGHIFWDADTWMFPALLLMHPDLAKSMAMFRYRTLEAAKERARALNYKGAMYPWESDELGKETTPKFAEQNALYEIHVTGDVAVAQWEYYMATGDLEWLRSYGYPVIEATADFWVSRSTWNKNQNRFEIRNVVSVDEGLIGINNDTYTNAVAKKNLEIAIRASELTGGRPKSEWKEVAAKLYIPYDDQKKFHPTYEDAPASSSGSVVTLLSFPLNLPMPIESKKNNLQYAVERMEKEGSGAMMTVTLFTVVAAELGDITLVNRLFPKTYQGYLRPPYNALAETPRNNFINFITGAGGFLQQWIYGYTGLRLTEEGVAEKFKPLLPSKIKSLFLKKFKIRNKTFNIHVENGSLKMIEA